jgi:hypothetical protein
MRIVGLDVDGDVVIEEGHVLPAFLTSPGVLCESGSVLVLIYLFPAVKVEYLYPKREMESARRYSTGEDMKPKHDYLTAPIIL